MPQRDEKPCVATAAAVYRVTYHFKTSNVCERTSGSYSALCSWLAEDLECASVQCHRLLSKLHHPCCYEPHKISQDIASANLYGDGRLLSRAQPG